MSRAGLLALAAAAALVLPASSPAATVGVEEPAPAPPAPPSGQAKLTFVAGPGEANRLTVSVAEEDPDFFRLRLVDSAAPVQPGPGCSGGGAPGAPVLCRVHKPTVGDGYICFKQCYASYGGAFDLNLSFALGDGGSHLDTTALPGYIPNKDAYSPSAPVEVTVVPGGGNDTVLTGPGPDEIKPSAGADLIRTGEGPDVFRAGTVADGPDVVDLGGDAYPAVVRGDVIDFSERSQGVRYDPNGRPDDGAAGEGDDLAAVWEVLGGAGADTLIGGAGDVLDFEPVLIGGAGDDVVAGSEGGDILFGGNGDDQLSGAGGDDRLRETTYSDKLMLGNDSADGGPGDDEIELGWGDDEAAGGPGRDLIALSRGSDSGKGGAGNDRLTGDLGRDRLLGGGGDDRIAAGMDVYWPLEHRAFLHSQGPLEGRPDSVGCGTGWDMVRAGAGDTAPGCERVLRAEPLELRGLEDGTRYAPPYVKFTIRRAGRARLGGEGLVPKGRAFGDDYGASTFYLRPVGQARQSLLRDGRVRLRLRLSYRAVDGREVVLFKAFELRVRNDRQVVEPA
ncbi:MAG TPA: calcium-binding protein [Solirubrobacterales bacterium]|nr:calcium-binding protein [Solirubrobacterales bacterium]